ncbi:MAG: acyltransferase [Verrucomicrobia bacterium]|nr:acyltransferase [Verrucomicrobiota bacterium]MBU1909824.1 acyltransferase [Verrucomicrobiota bacterium]
MKALAVIGLKKTFRFLCGEAIRFVFCVTILPPIRVALLRLLGAKVGKNVVIHRFEFINYYRGSFANISIGDECFIGNGVLFDLADTIVLERQVTISERVVLMTHLNVGYMDHPLQASFPSTHKGVHIRRGCFIGVNATILQGVDIGSLTLVAAGAVVTKSLPGNVVCAGVPAKVIRA